MKHLYYDIFDRILESSAPLLA